MSVSPYPALRRLLFQLDPESVHHLTLGAAALAERILPKGWASRRKRVSSLTTELAGVRFPAPVGLAAGFDKDGVAPHLWAALGFGFAELGTVTGEAQPGNPRPRLFRLEEDAAVINRMGFNSSGSAAVADALGARLHPRPAIPIGINIGCSRKAVGDPEAELADLLVSTRRLAPMADYLAVNVSSPNTPGLRDLQAPGALERLVRGVVEAAAETSRAPAVFVKLAPDLADEDLPGVAAAALEAGARGLIAINTTVRRQHLRGKAQGETGGLSGRPLADRADQVIRRVRSAIGSEVPLIGVGGVFGLADVLRRMAAGADLVQVYTGLIYEGPRLLARLNQGVADEIARRQCVDLGELRAELRSA